MHRLIIGLIDGQPGEIGRHRGIVDLEAELITTFDGSGRLITGRAVGEQSHDVEVPIVHDESITTEQEERTERVLTEYVMDLGADPAYVAVDSSAGDFLWEWLELEWGVDIHRAWIDVDAVAETVRDLDRSKVWQTGWNREGGDSVGVNYHRDAHLTGEEGLTQLGFRAQWAGGYFEGTMASSGYLAEFSGEPIESVANWIRSEILPHTAFEDPEAVDEEETEQAGFGGVV